MGASPHGERGRAAEPGRQRLDSLHSYLAERTRGGRNLELVRACTLILIVPEFRMLHGASIGDTKEMVTKKGSISVGTSFDISMVVE